MAARPRSIHRRPHCSGALWETPGRHASRHVPPAARQSPRRTRRHALSRHAPSPKWLSGWPGLGAAAEPGMPLAGARVRFWPRARPFPSQRHVINPLGHQLRCPTALGAVLVCLRPHALSASVFLSGTRPSTRPAPERCLLVGAPEYN